MIVPVVVLILGIILAIYLHRENPYEPIGVGVGLAAVFASIFTTLLCIIWHDLYAESKRLQGLNTYEPLAVQTSEENVDFVMYNAEFVNLNKKFGVKFKEGDSVYIETSPKQQARGWFGLTYNLPETRQLVKEKHDTLQNRK
jgi:hypothetical protein